MKFIPIISLLLIICSCGINELPEPSMEKELLVGDFLFIDKLNYKLKDSNVLEFNKIDSVIDTNINSVHGEVFKLYK